MKLSFSTLGCPDWDLESILTNARALGYDGVEMRGLAGTLDISATPEFGADIVETAARFRDAGIAVSCLDTSARAVVKSAAQRSDGIEEVGRYAVMCPQLGMPLIRVFGGSLDGVERPDAIRAAGENLREMIARADEYGARIIVETHDDWLTGRDVADLLDATNDDRVGVLWDTHHTYRMGKESPEETWRLLGSRIWGTHLKDSVPDPDDEDGSAYCLTGEGDIPLQQIVDVLSTGGFKGFLTLEWEKRWHPDLAQPEIAFPPFVAVIRELLGQPG